MLIRSSVSALSDCLFLALSFTVHAVALMASSSLVSIYISGIHLMTHGNHCKVWIAEPILPDHSAIIDLTQLQWVGMLIHLQRGLFTSILILKWHCIFHVHNTGIVIILWHLGYTLSASMSQVCMPLSLWVTVISAGRINTWCKIMVTRQEVLVSGSIPHYFRWA